jgi:thiol-disulfide isomerase/thioredoxin
MLILVLVGLLHLQGYAKQVTKVQTETVQHQVLDQTTIKTVDGEVIHIDRTKNGLIFKGYEDKIVLLEAFGLGCGPCKAAIPGYNRLQKKYKKDIVVIAVDAWGSDRTKLQEYVQTFGIEYKTVSTDDSGKVLHFIQKLTGWNSGMGVPYLMLFSRGGVLWKDVPPQFFPEEHVNNLIQELLKKRR